MWQGCSVIYSQSATIPPTLSMRKSGQYLKVCICINLIYVTHQPPLGPRGGLWPILLMC
jgi:hypothetical protein